MKRVQLFGCSSCAGACHQATLRSLHSLWMDAHLRLALPLEVPPLCLSLPVRVLPVRHQLGAPSVALSLQWQPACRYVSAKRGQTVKGGNSSPNKPGGCCSCGKAAPACSVATSSWRCSSSAASWRASAPASSARPSALAALLCCAAAARCASTLRLRSCNGRRESSGRLELVQSTCWCYNTGLCAARAALPGHVGQHQLRSSLKIQGDGAVPCLLKRLSCFCQRRLRLVERLAQARGGAAGGGGIVVHVSGGSASLLQDFLRSWA